MKKAEDAQRLLRTLSTEMPEGWKKDYAGVRNEYRQAMEDAARQAALEINQTDPEVIEQFKKLRDDLFSSLSNHQARWPVLLLSEQRSVEYRQSVQAFEAKHSEFVRFMRQST
ncbi:hypothetical protein [Parerythrobacter aestuarii]|uniref:hypothetical protein n=1 Tax=Parerythrobacter aestuarii TaxID=3020909 RepID=UPI0024DEFD01|nr:hypothetical protein [Parerythrobacter aestuarii]